MKKFIAIVFSFALLISMTIPAYGITNTKAMQQSINTISILDLGGMNVTELNEFIHEVASQSSTSSTSTYGVSSSLLSKAWYAAGRIAYLKGYTCAGTLVMYSAQGKNYTETNGLFANKIAKTSKYKTWKSNYSSSSPTSLSFESSDNADLYYSLHAVNIGMSGNSQGGTIVISDTFDFDAEDQFSSPFVKFVNDFAWLSQRTGALTVISVRISITA
ncbi:MAG: hypothetical protein MR939_02245 [Clostridiales bacterium]|nr:hypothetical protein [Clostridiales bacterium]MDD7387625.1 hypothetical protein [Bacillota bacterium]MDY6041466.1 hypothetical protein [Candidatus Faecousia sp.]